MFGTDLAEDFYGLGGNDTIFARGGNDRIDGGDGNDILYGDLGDDTLYGGDGHDELNGGAGDDLLIGRTPLFGLALPGFDVDTLNGGEGNDTIAITDNSSNQIDGGLGFDVLYFALNPNELSPTINLTLLWIFGSSGTIGSGTVSNVEGIKDNIVNLTNYGDTVFIGDGYRSGLSGVTMRSYAGNDNLGGSGGHDDIFAGTGNDRVAGGPGNDIIRGEEGDDDLRGEAGNDTLVGGIGNDRLDGSSGDDYLVGGDGIDQLIGGAGINTLQGGLGDDVYTVGNRTDSVIEFAGEGTDLVQTTFSIFALQANIENLTYTDNTTHGAGVGNALANVITGGTGIDDLFGREGNDTLIGGSGAANSLFGQEGDDLYIVASAGDSVIEFFGQGNDTVQTALASFVLRDNVENLIYTGSTDFTGIGASDNNVISGGAGADFLSGLDGNDVLTGKSGADLLLGGNGADQFRYAGGEIGYDRIIDFTSGQDTIALSSAGFARTAFIDFIQTGAPTPASTNSTFLYDVNSGILSYDADGTGAGAAIELVQLNAGMTLSAGDFVFY
jgi:Ca2+-binding RTX toxin-like protein